MSAVTVRCLQALSHPAAGLDGCDVVGKRRLRLVREAAQVHLLAMLPQVRLPTPRAAVVRHSSVLGGAARTAAVHRAPLLAALFSRATLDAQQQIRLRLQKMLSRFANVGTPCQQKARYGGSATRLLNRARLFHLHHRGVWTAYRVAHRVVADQRLLRWSAPSEKRAIVRRGGAVRDCCRKLAPCDSPWCAVGPFRHVSRCAAEAQVRCQRNTPQHAARLVRRLRRCMVCVRCSACQSRGSPLVEARSASRQRELAACGVSL